MVTSEYFRMENQEVHQFPWTLQFLFVYTVLKNKHVAVGGSIVLYKHRFKSP